MAADLDGDGTNRSAWRYGTRRSGEVLVVRDPWQGLFGPNAW